VLLVGLGTVLNYLSRSTLSVAAPELMRSLAMTTRQYSYVVAAFQAAYAVAQPFAGYVLDVIGLRIGFAVFAAAWSAANLSVTFAGQWTGLAAARGFLGLAESAGIPAAMKAVTRWFPSHERSIATGWFNAGASVGSMLAPPLVVYCIVRYDWRAAFLVTGGLGILWAILWFIAYRPPEAHPLLSAGERRHILAGQTGALSGQTGAAAVEGAKPSWRGIIFNRRFAGIAAARFLSEPAWQTINYWIPVYLVTVRHLDLESIAAFAWIPFLAADLGSIAGGYLAPFFGRQFNMTVVASLKLVVATGCLGMAGPAAIGAVASAPGTIGLFCVGALAHQTLSGALYALTANVFAPHEIASAVGLTGSAGYVGGLLFSLAIGAVASRIGFGPVFFSMWMLDLAAAGLVWIALRPAR
jgi:ACS family hexuronate transporter-like MFS transporter